MTLAIAVSAALADCGSQPATPAAAPSPSSTPSATAPASPAPTHTPGPGTTLPGPSTRVASSRVAYPWHWLWSKPDSTWAWSLTPTAMGRTRLVARIRTWYDWQHPLTGLSAVLLMEFGDFAMLRRMLRGINARAESRPARVSVSFPG